MDKARRQELYDEAVDKARDRLANDIDSAARTFDIHEADPATKESSPEYRIEALRAASRIVAGIYQGAGWDHTMSAEWYCNLAIERAEPIAKWLETGER